jgi:hypothetical protein
VQDKPQKKLRDVRLDLFRGLAMLIIIIAHAPGNPWNDWIPARFGFSSAAEMFVFCSGIASALAFGGIFSRQGLWLGTARIAHRIWQLYWSQIAVFLVVVAMAVWASANVGTRDYIAKLYLEWFLTDPAAAIPALLTLRYIPNFFDMLPLYMLLLAAIPLVMTLARISPRLVFALSIALWLLVQIAGTNLSARPETEQVWFFNPLAWQLLFFTGFGFGMGWLPVPPLRHKLLMPLAIAFVVASIPLNFWAILGASPALQSLHDALVPNAAPTDLHVLRYLHFLAMAYLALCVIEPYRASLPQLRVLSPVIRIGQQTLAVFLCSVPLSLAIGVAMDALGRDALTVALLNLAGLGACIVIAWVVAWFKSAPWLPRKAAPSPAHASQPPAEDQQDKARDASAPAALTV